jgi:hypothetical protein
MAPKEEDASIFSISPPATADTDACNLPVRKQSSFILYLELATLDLSIVFNRYIMGCNS